jgi:Phytanoyl-CoA dioxygenase (PhyH)
MNMFTKIEKIAKGIPQLRAEAAYYLKLLRHARKLPPLSADERAIVTACQQEGVCMTSLEALNIAATPAMLAAATRHLAMMEARARPADEQGTTDRPALPQIFTMTDLPEFSKWGEDPKIMRLVENYVGLPVKFQGVHLRRDFANETPVTTELWHRDGEDRRIIKVFIYLTDVGIENGPFEYVPRRPSKLKRRQVDSQVQASLKQSRMGLNDQEMAALVPRSEWRACPCPAGTVVIADTRSVFHHGQSRRLARSAIFLVYTAQQPLHPEYCTQYYDRTYARPEQVENVLVTQ